MVAQEVKNPHRSRAAGHSVTMNGIFTPRNGNRKPQQSCGVWTHFSGINKVEMYLFKLVTVYRPQRIDRTAADIFQCISFLKENGYRASLQTDSPAEFIKVGIERILDENTLEQLKGRGWEIYRRL